MAGILQGVRGNAPKPIASVDDAGTERLAVDAKFTTGFVAEVNLDLANDEVMVGNTTDGGTTRNLAKGDASGRFVVTADAAAPVPVSDNGATLSVDDGAGSLTVDGTVDLGASSLAALESITVQNGAGASAVNIQDGGNSITVDGTLTAVGPAADGAAVSGNPVRIGGKDGSGNTQDIITHTDGRLRIIQASSSTTLGDSQSNSPDEPSNETGPLTHRAYGFLFNAATGFWARMRGDTGGQFVHGTVAHDAVDSGNPQKVGGKAIAHGTNPTAVAAADRTDWYFNRAGVPFVMGGHPNVQTIEYRWTTAPTDDDIILVGAGTKIVVTSLLLTLDEATTVGVKARVGFGTASVPAEPADQATVAGILLSHGGVVPGGGISRGDGSGILGVGADGEDLRITATAPTTGEAHLIVSYYTIES